MKILSYLLKQINLLNLILLIIIILFANFVILPMLNIEIKYSPAASKKPVESDETKEEKSAQNQMPPYLDYIMVAEDNLFHPERKIPVEKKDEKVMPKPELILYGTLITDGISYAYVEDKKSVRTTPGRGKRQIVLRNGDSISGFVLKEIHPDRIVLSRGEESMTVNLMDKSKVRESSGAPSPSTAPAQKTVPPQQRLFRPPQSPVPQPMPQPGVEPPIEE